MFLEHWVLSKPVSEAHVPKFPARNRFPISRKYSFDYFQSIDLTKEVFNFDYKSNHFANNLLYYSEENQDLSDVFIAIIGIEEERI